MHRKVVQLLQDKGGGLFFIRISNLHVYCVADNKMGDKLVLFHRQLDVTWWQRATINPERKEHCAQVEKRASVKIRVPSHCAHCPDKDPGPQRDLGVIYRELTFHPMEQRGVRPTPVFQEVTVSLGRTQHALNST